MELQRELDALRSAVHADRPDTVVIYSILERVLSWLNENNTDENCRKVDTFISTQVDPTKVASLPEELSNLIRDMGGALHDTHTAPDVAANFQSTPPQLLERLGRLMREEIE